MGLGSWQCNGLSEVAGEIPTDHATGRTEHVFNMKPRRFEPMEEADLEAMAMALWP